MCMLVVVRPSGPLVLLLIFFIFPFFFLLLFQVLKKLQTSSVLSHQHEGNFIITDL